MKNYWSAWLLISLFIHVLSTPSWAQPDSRLTSGFDAGAGWKDKAWTVSALYHQYLKVDRRGLLQVGWGVRGSHSRGKELDFTTDPSRLTKGKTGFSALNAPIILRQIDTLQMKTGITSFNFNVSAQISLFGRLDIGANADILGFALGNRRAGYYLGSRGYNKVDSLNLHQTYQQARPARLNILWLGDDRRGNLNAEIYARILFMQRVGVKVSYFFTTNEYRTDQPLVDDNQRFRFRSQMIYIGLTFPIDG
jgi:hypothetical protein